MVDAAGRGWGLEKERALGDSWKVGEGDLVRVEGGAWMGKAEPGVL